MRLTQEMRKQFVSKVMESVKWKSKWPAERITEELKQRLLATEPPEVLAVYKKYPGKLSYRSVTVRWMRHKVRDRHMILCSRDYYATAVGDTNLDLIECEDLKRCWDDRMKEDVARQEAEERLSESAASVNTVEQLHLLFPKLTRHMPLPAAKTIKMLPVARDGLYQDLVKLGLSVGKEK